MPGAYTIGTRATKSKETKNRDVCVQSTIHGYSLPTSPLHPPLSIDAHDSLASSAQTFTGPSSSIYRRMPQVSDILAQQQWHRFLDFDEKKNRNKSWLFFIFNIIAYYRFFQWNISPFHFQEGEAANIVLPCGEVERRWKDSNQWHLHSSLIGLMAAGHKVECSQTVCTWRTLPTSPSSGCSK